MAVSPELVITSAEGEPLVKRNPNPAQDTEHWTKHTGFNLWTWRHETGNSVSFNLTYAKIFFIPHGNYTLPITITGPPHR